MSELKTPTINGLVEKLYDENYIEDKEKDTIKVILEQSTSGMENDDVTLLIAKLNAKIDAHSSDLITQNRLNYASFDEAIKTSTREIKKEKAEREKSQAQSTVDPLQEKKDVEKTPQEKAEMERQERIANNRSYIDKMMEENPAFKNIKLSDDCKNKVAEKMEEKRKLNELYKENIAKGQSPEMATKNAYITVRVNRDENDLYGEAANATLVFEMLESIDPDITDAQVEERLNEKLSYQELTQNPAVREYIEQGKRKGIGIREIIKEALSLPLTVLQERSQESSENLITGIQTRIDSKDGAIIDAINSKNGIEARSVLSLISEREDAKIMLIEQRVNEVTITQDVKERKEAFFEGITKRYLSSYDTISNIYDSLQDNDEVKKLEYELGIKFEFEDYIRGIKENLEKDGSQYIATITNSYLNELIESERKIRRADILKSVLEETQERGNPILDEEFCKNYQEAIQKAQKNADDYKSKFAQRKGLVRKDDSINKEPIKKNKVKTKKLEKDIVRISKDRKEILRIAEEQNITPDEAAKQYFSKNENAFMLYTKKEMQILTGTDNTNKRDIRTNNVLIKLRLFQRVKNRQLISEYESEIERLTKSLEDSEKDPKELDAELKLLSNTKKRLLKAYERKRKLEKKTKGKSAMGILDEKMKKEFEADVFECYIKSGKTAVDFLEEFYNSKNAEYDLNQNDILRIIEQNAKKYIKPEEFASLIQNEKDAFKNKDELYRLRIKKEKGLTNWTESNEREFETKEIYQKGLEEATAKYREKIMIRMGLKTKYAEKIENPRQQTEERQIIDSEEIKTKNSAEVVQEQEGQAVEIKCGLAVEQIEVTGMKPNVKAIAQKGNVTPSKVKKVFAKIVGLGKSKEKDAEQIKHETSPEEKTTNTNSETGGR